MPNHRLQIHPILPIPQREGFEFYWEENRFTGLPGETISAALFANGVHVFGHHLRDGSPQGIYCANGQCAQCLVLENGKPVKACMELVSPEARIEPLNTLPKLPESPATSYMQPVEELRIPVLIIGGGPAGLSAAIELGKLGVPTLLIDDKHHLGGKMVLQTHRFFGSREAVYAGTRGIDIAARMADEVKSLSPYVQVWLNSTALAVFSDRKVGILRDGSQYVLVKPEALLVASGAREKSLAFRGNWLPGVYGAGAFQTLLNRDLVLPAQHLFIVGGGNVGLIAAYHALQAGVEVVGLVEALPECGGYKVHQDKLKRLGVPIFTSHTILSANGDQTVESATIAQVDARFQPIPDTEKTFACDAILIAVGLDPVNEFYTKAREFDLPVFTAGDAGEIAEASAAIYSGKIQGFEIARSLSYPAPEIPEEWRRQAEILKSKPGKLIDSDGPDAEPGVYPMIHCLQEIPCDPCSSVCPRGLIQINREDIRKTPVFDTTQGVCSGCERCVAICPGLAITLVDSRKDPEHPLISLPFEFPETLFPEGELVTVVDIEGNFLADLPVVKIRHIKANDRTRIVRVQAPRELARKIAGIRLLNQSANPLKEDQSADAREAMICRCERVSAAEIRSLIRAGIHDLNEIKAVTRAGMGACGSKTCGPLIRRLLLEEGVPSAEIMDLTRRPLFVEVPLGVFAGVKPDSGGDGDR
ncbi:MAG: FAD-dependent oxidoreductase [Chloroflexi bacterium]|nr:FAD-dependent oxidoreductase [Chloroflexota bacterium]